PISTALLPQPTTVLRGAFSFLIKYSLHAK
ncbi:MAG: hypothetical protein ACI8SA_002521, partial [Dokdonia sp.]